VFIKVDGTSFTEMFAANDWKPFQSCYSNSASTVILRLEHLCIELMAKHIKDMVEKEPFKALVQEDANNIRERQETELHCHCG
jgi:hypothetical protein